MVSDSEMSETAYSDAENQIQDKVYSQSESMESIKDDISEIRNEESDLGVASSSIGSTSTDAVSSILTASNSRTEVTTVNYENDNKSAVDAETPLQCSSSDDIASIGEADAITYKSYEDDDLSDSYETKPEKRETYFAEDYENSNDNSACTTNPVPSSENHQILQNDVNSSINMSNQAKQQLQQNIQETKAVSLGKINSNDNVPPQFLQTSPQDEHTYPVTPNTRPPMERFYSSHSVAAIADTLPFDNRTPARTFVPRMAVITSNPRRQRHVRPARRRSPTREGFFEQVADNVYSVLDNVLTEISFSSFDLTLPNGSLCGGPVLDDELFPQALNAQNQIIRGHKLPFLQTSRPCAASNMFPAADNTFNNNRPAYDSNFSTHANEQRAMWGPSAVLAQSIAKNEAQHSNEVIRQPIHSQSNAQFIPMASSISNADKVPLPKF